MIVNNQHKPLVHYEEPEQVGNEPSISCSGADPSSTLSDPEVMEIDEDQ
jgi:hypothetical protein